MELYDNIILAFSLYVISLFSDKFVIRNAVYIIQ